ncbi:MAG: histidine phosphatase family protein, partial [Mycobacterium sp.]|nr:histidine phosphatase family protein [Mycobacterium sp.]
MRTRQTLERTRVAASVNFSERLYGATPGTMIDEINRVAEEVATLLVVGHEPTVSHVALGLAG